MSKTKRVFAITAPSWVGRTNNAAITEQHRKDYDDIQGAGERTAGSTHRPVIQGQGRIWPGSPKVIPGQGGVGVCVCVRTRVVWCLHL